MNLSSFMGQRRVSVLRNLRDNLEKDISPKFPKILSSTIGHWKLWDGKAKTKPKKPKPTKPPKSNPWTNLFSFANSAPVTSLRSIRLNHDVVLSELKTKKWNKVQGSHGSLQLSVTQNVSHTKESEGQVEGVRPKKEMYRSAREIKRVSIWPGSFQKTASR